MFGIVLYIGGQDIIFAVLIALLLFGSNEIPKLARTFGKGMKEFKRATDDIKREFENSTPEVMEDFKDIKKNLTKEANEIKKNLTKDTTEITKNFTKDTTEIRKNLTKNADDIMKGINDFDVELAYKAMKKSAMEDHLGLEFYKEQGFIPVDKEHEAVSKTLEYRFPHSHRGD